MDFYFYSFFSQRKKIRDLFSLAIHFFHTKKNMAATRSEISKKEKKNYTDFVAHIDACALLTHTRSGEIRVVWGERYHGAVCGCLRVCVRWINSTSTVSHSTQSDIHFASSQLIVVNEMRVASWARHIAIFNIHFVWASFTHTQFDVYSLHHNSTITFIFIWEHFPSYPRFCFLNPADLSMNIML